MKLFVTGDLSIIHPYNVSTQLDKSVVDMFAKSDINIVNLEAPVTESKSKILKTGLHLKSDRKSVTGIVRMLNVKVDTLANNHLLDYGEQGVSDTLTFCKEQGIETVGGGMSLYEASKTLHLKSMEGKIAIVNFAENEWASATLLSAGANPMNVIDNTRKIKTARDIADYVIVIIHGGHEYYNLPSPRMVNQYHFYAEQAADLIVGHHTHCMNGYEIYNGVPIYYSLGNFLFTMNSNNDDWYIGLILEVNITSKGIDCQIHPVKQGKENFNLTLLDGIDKESVLNRIDSYCNVIKDSDKLYENWNKYVVRQSKQYLNYLSPLSSIINRYIEGIFRKLGINFYNKKAASLHLNLMRCEAHHDLSEEILEISTTR